MCTNASTDKGIWGQHAVNIEVGKHRVRENVPNASCTTEEDRRSYVRMSGHRQRHRHSRQRLFTLLKTESSSKELYLLIYKNKQIISGNLRRNSFQDVMKTVKGDWVCFIREHQLFSKFDLWPTASTFCRLNVQISHIENNSYPR